MVQSLQGQSLEERVAYYNELRGQSEEDFVAQFEQQLRVIWIHHDSLLEGVVYTPDDLQSAFHTEPVSESSMSQEFYEIRNHLQAIEYMFECAGKKRFTLTLDVVKKLFGILAPEELEGKGQATYRKDMPISRLYFHEFAPPEKISYRMRQLMQWVNAPETKKSTHAVRLAARCHHQMMHIYPFPRLSGKVARLVMNLVLVRAGFPPAIIHGTERQRYYEVLKTSEDATADMVREALGASLESSIRVFEEHLGIAIDE